MWGRSVTVCDLPGVERGYAMMRSRKNHLR